jgi:hypothetical protein
MPMLTRCLCALLLSGLAAPAAAESWTRTSDVGRDPVSKITREQFDLSATGRVHVQQIGDAVRIKAGDGNTVAYEYHRRAASQKDFDCETLKVERRDDEFRIWVEHKRERACRVVRAQDELTLVVPRGASVTVRDVGNEVEVSDVEGMVRLSDIGNSVTLTGAQQVDAKDIGNEVEVTVTRLGAGGIQIADIGNSVELNLPEKLDARVRISDFGNRVRGPGLSLNSGDLDEDRRGYETVLGAGGPLIRIEDIGNSIVIRGPQLGD